MTQALFSSILSYKDWGMPRKSPICLHDICTKQNKYSRVEQNLGPIPYQFDTVNREFRRLNIKRQNKDIYSAQNLSFKFPINKE